MRPGCIFVSHRSILIWLICFFFNAFANIAGVFGFFLPLFVIFWMLYFFNFPKSHVFHVLARHFYLWRVSDELKVWAFTPSEVLLEGGGGEFCRDGRWHKLIWFSWVLREASCMGFVCSTVTTGTHTPQFTNGPGPCSVLPFPPALSSVFLFTASSFDCYSQLAESTFSTCAIQRYFSTSLYSFWGFWCTFFMICVYLY